MCGAIPAFILASRGTTVGVRPVYNYLSQMHEWVQIIYTIAYIISNTKVSLTFQARNVRGAYDAIFECHKFVLRNGYIVIPI